MKKKRKPTITRARRSNLASLKKKLWAVFSLYIRTRDKFTCFTCGRKGSGSAIHAGHFIPRSSGGLGLYFHEDNVHAQCYHCNINLGGNQWEYGQRLGEKKVKELFEIKRKITQWSEADYLEKIGHYKYKLKKLSPTK